MVRGKHSGNAVAASGRPALAELGQSKDKKTTHVKKNKITPVSMAAHICQVEEGNQHVCRGSGHRMISIGANEDDVADEEAWNVKEQGSPQSAKIDVQESPAATGLLHATPGNHVRYVIILSRVSPAWF